MQANRKKIDDDLEKFLYDALGQVKISDSTKQIKELKKQNDELIKQVTSLTKQNDELNNRNCELHNKLEKFKQVFSDFSK